MSANRKSNTRELLHKELSYTLQGFFYDIRNQYGPGHKEVVYQRVLEEKLSLVNLVFEREKRIPIYSYDTGKIIGGYKPDFLVEEKIIIELKATRLHIQEDEKQLYFYLRNSVYELGYLVNFSTPNLLIKRIVYSNNRKPYLRVSR